MNVISLSSYLLVFTLSHLPTIDEAQKESNKRGELERSPNKRREVAPVWGPQFWLDGFWCSEMPVECSLFNCSKMFYFGRVFATIPYSWNMTALHHRTAASILSSVHLTFPCLLGLRVSAYDAPFPMFNPPATEEEQRPGSLCFLQGELCER